MRKQHILALRRSQQIRKAIGRILDMAAWSATTGCLSSTNKEN
jgi:hypothetical protein